MAQHGVRLPLLLVTGLAVATSLAACGGSSDDAPSPAPSEAAPQAAIPVEPPEPELPIPPVDTTSTSTDVDAPVVEAIESSSPAETDATASAGATPNIAAEVDIPTPIEEADTPPPIVPLTAASDGPAVPVTGPLLILSEALEYRGGRWKVYEDERQVWLQDRTSRVYLYDVSTDQYWTPFDYRHTTLVATQNDYASFSNLNIARSGIQPAGTHLIAWTDDQVHRVALTGHLEAMLFEHAEIRTIKVSPDGTHVAVLYGEPGTLVVLNAINGAERLRVAGDDPALEPLHDNGGTVRLEMGNWHADGNALSIADRPARYLDADTAILGLDGSIRVLPQDWWSLSPDLRYAIRVGGVIPAVPGSAPIEHQYIWDRWEVFDVETGRLLWTIGDESGIQWPDQIPTWSGGSQYLGFYLPSIGGQVLDTATGEIGSLTPAIEETLRGPVLSNCHTRLNGDPCTLQYNGRIVWEGARGWTGYWGRIELPDAVTLPGITLRHAERYRLPDFPGPPPRDAIVGPLLVYEIGMNRDSSSDQIRRVIVFDEGTGSNWALFDYSDLVIYWIYWRTLPVQAAHGGLVSLANREHALIYITPDGQASTLSTDIVERGGFQVSPDGRRVVAQSTPSRDVLVFDLLSNDRLLRIDHDDLIAAWEENLPADRAPHGSCAENSWRPCYLIDLNAEGSGNPHAWSADSTTILIRVGISSSDDFDWIGAGTVTLDGAIEFLNSRDHPDPLEPESEPRGRIDCLDNPAHSCRILLDGEVVGEGHWPAIIGVVELD